MESDYGASFEYIVYILRIFTSHEIASPLSNIIFTWTHKIDHESNLVFVHDAITLHETQCGMHCMRVQSGTCHLLLVIIVSVGTIQHALHKSTRWH